MINYLTLKNCKDIIRHSMAKMS